LSKDVDIILIDTAGKSPRDAKQIAETKTMLDVCGSRAEAHLAISSVTKSADIVEIMRQFEPYAYRAVIVTKIDETRQIGNVLSALSESGKAVSFLTDGQETTPNTIHKASAFRMLLQLDGFEADRDRLEKKFAERKPEALA
jgi:flagellar biosynthesis protein FlhF